MYRCHIHFYLIGDGSLWRPIEAFPSPERFTHTFSRSALPEAAPLSQADAVFADLRGLDAREVLRTLLAGRKEGAELVLLAEEGQMGSLADCADDGVDIWRLPITEEELGFRFRRWHREYKKSKDSWEISQFLDATINESPNLVWYKSKDGIHEKVNDSFCRTVNKTKRQVEGQRHAYIWNVEHDDPACIESENEVMRSRKTRKSLEVVQTGSGERRLTTYKAPLYDLDGSVMGTVGVAVDVTKEHAYEEQLLEKSNTLEKLFSTIDCGVLCHSLDGRHVSSVNEAALRLLGYGSKEELMRDGFDLVAESVLDEDKPVLRECINSLTEAGDSATVEYRVRHKDGEILHILGNVKLMQEDGELFYQRFLLDYTAQKRREEEKWAQKDREIEYQEQLFKIFSSFLSNNVDDIYVMLDEKAEKAEFVSTNVERVLGLSCESVERNPKLLTPVRYTVGQSVTREELDALQPGSSLAVMESERVHQQTGEHRWFRESICCVSVQGVKKLIVYISDRTQERKIQDTLTEALDIAQVANKAKSTFLSNVSHDIRTPMNAIMGFIPLLREEADDPERVLEYTQKISAASQHLLGLINSVLDMNKIESGSAVLNISELSLAEVIEELNIIIRPQAKAKEQTFQIYTSSLTSEHLLGDKLRINQILLNILSNAVKYTPNGGAIEMRVRELPQVDNNYCRIQFVIHDNGQGMSEDYQKVIFDPFTRELETSLNKIQGSGLGMAITKSLVELMNGSIRVESELGKGSTFTVELELRVQEKEEEPHFWDDHGIVRMIVVDDDEDICHDIVKKMNGTGVNVDYSTSGIVAVDMMRSARKRGEPYDLILLDWKMPDVDGLAVAQQIREKYSVKVPILLFTAYDWSEIEQEALEVGIEHFLPKPFFMSNFKDTISRMGTKRETSSIKEGDNPLRGKRVLVVDDIDVNRLVLTKILTTLDAKCDMAVNGQDAVDKFTAAPAGTYDIIFMDIQMPILNGYEATRAIRASGHPSAQSVAIIAMTANAFVDDIRDALRSGMDAHIPKPIVLDQFKRIVKEVLERKAIG